MKKIYQIPSVKVRKTLLSVSILQASSQNRTVFSVSSSTDVVQESDDEITYGGKGTGPARVRS